MTINSKLISKYSFVFLLVFVFAYFDYSYANQCGDIKNYVDNIIPFASIGIVDGGFFALSILLTNLNIDSYLQVFFISYVPVVIVFSVLAYSKSDPFRMVVLFTGTFYITHTATCTLRSSLMLCVYVLSGVVFVSQNFTSRALKSIICTFFHWTGALTFFDNYSFRKKHFPILILAMFVLAIICFKYLANLDAIFLSEGSYGGRYLPVVLVLFLYQISINKNPNQINILIIALGAILALIGINNTIRISFMYEFIFAYNLARCKEGNTLLTYLSGILLVMIQIYYILSVKIS